MAARHVVNYVTQGVVRARARALTFLVDACQVRRAIRIVGALRPLAKRHRIAEIGFGTMAPTLMAAVHSTLGVCTALSVAARVGTFSIDTRHRRNTVRISSTANCEERRNELLIYSRAL